VPAVAGSWCAEADLHGINAQNTWCGNVHFAPFYTIENRIFAKTGSGQP
jgi:hypothetical protein